MCLAVPLKLIDVEGHYGTVEMGNIRRRVNLSLVEGVTPGDYVIVHAGFAITLLDETEAQKTLDLMNELEKRSGNEGF